MSEENNPPLLKNHWAKESSANSIERPFCICLGSQREEIKWTELTIHQEVQDENAAGWIRLQELINEAISDGREEFSPLREMTPEQWIEIVTLPPSIAQLKNVKHFIVYGSSLVRIPPEVGEMTNLEEFTPYTSYRLHWFPYEIRRCKKLKRSTVSTRAVYLTTNSDLPFRLCRSIQNCIAHKLATFAMVPSTMCLCNDGLRGEWVRISFHCWCTLVRRLALIRSRARPTTMSNDRIVVGSV
jgi:hypothetical protein